MALCGCMIFGNSAYAAEIERETITVEMETPNDDQQSEEKEESDSNELPAGEDEPEKLEDESEKPEDEENLEDQADPEEKNDPEEKDDSEEKDDQNDADRAEEAADDNTAVLNIVGDGEIRSRNISDKRVKAYAINARSGSTINHKGGKISGFYGVNVDTGNLTCSGKYEVVCEAIYASGVIYIDGADVVVNAQNNPSSVSTIGISVHPFDQECYIKNTKVRMNVSGEGEAVSF